MSFRVISIVVTYNGQKWVDKSLKSLVSSKTEGHKVLVVDNNSSDGTAETIKQKYPSVRVLEMSNNLGFGRANNVGLSIAFENNFEYAFLLNQDAWIYPNSISKLINAAESNPEYGLISPLHLTGNGDRLDGSFHNCVCHKNCPELCSDAILGRGLQDVYETSTLIAASWLMSRETLETVGAFDPMFFHYGEDNNYVQRVRYHGLKAGVCPHSKIHHDRENREQNPTYDSRKFEINSMIKYANVNINGPEKLKNTIRRLKMRLLYEYLTFGDDREIISDKLDTLSAIVDDIRESWQKNRKPGPRYLNTDFVED